MPAFILPLSDSQAALENIGGKGLSLAKMLQAGFPVPDGFHITTEAYRQFVIANGLQTKILAALKDVDTSLPASLETASATIGRFFADASISSDIASTITDAYLKLETSHPSTSPRTGVTLPVAVRSSATAEDLPAASFAGQQETFLNIRGEDALLDAVKKCWASLWTARAIAYRIKNNIDQNCVALAIVVQEMVDAEAAGILFTANPINGKRDEMVVNAAWGLGEAIVGGLVSPDTIVADKATGKVKKYEVAEKAVITVLTESGTRENPLDDARRRSRVLKEAEVIELVSIARRIESYYGSPQDIEWCLTSPPSPLPKGEGRKFYIVQSRPVTALPPEPLEWKIPFPKAVLARGSFAEFVPEPVSPLFATLAIPIARKTTVNLMGGFGVGGENSYLLEVLNDYVYVGFIFSSKIIWPMIKASFKLLGPLLKSTPQRAVTAREKFLAVVQTWQARDPAALAPSELLAGVREIFTETALYYNMAQSGTIPTAMVSEATFGAFYKMFVKRRNDPKTEAFVFGTENHAMRAEKALFDIARWIKEQPELADYIARTPVEEICEALHIDSLPDSATGKFAARFDSYLREYGHAIYDLDFAKPTPAESPEALVETLKVYLAGKKNPYERQRAAMTLREQSEATISKRLDPLRRKYFLQLLKWAQETAPLREDSIADVGLGHPQIRRMLSELGRRLVKDDAIPNADDIYWLEVQELDELAARLEKSETLRSFTAEIEKRKAKWQAMRHIIPPNTLPRVSWLSKLYSDNEQTGNQIKGFAASAGKVTARACVMLGPEDFGKMQPGDAIVTGITTPAWTPLFARASAIVTDIGGPLSHSSIVAREYGIPAVLATGVGTRRIQDGQTITVDGSKGEVVLESTAEETSPPLEWNLPQPHTVAMRMSFVEFVPDAVSPLFATLAVPIASQATSKLMLEVMGWGEQGYYFDVVNGYVYGCMDTRQIFKYFVVGIAATPKILRYGKALRDKAPLNSRTIAAKWQEMDLSALPAIDLANGVRELFDAAAYYFTMAQSGPIPSSTMNEALFSRVYNMLIKRKSDPAASTFLIGLDDMPLRAEKSLFDLAQWVQTQTTLADYLRRTPAQAIWETLQTDLIAAPLSGEFSIRFTDHLNTFGHAIYDLDFTKSVPADNPAPLLETLKAYLVGQGHNPYIRIQSQTEQRQQAERSIAARLDPLRRKWFLKLLRAAQESGPDRENAIADLGLTYPQIKRALRELGLRLMAGGAIACPNDIYWLEASELDELSASLDKRELLTNHATRVEKRKADWQRSLKETPPAFLATNKWLSKMMMPKKSSTSVLKGYGASAGKITAPARILRSSDDFEQMRPGEVLVAVTTTPAWTPLFTMASAIVTDIGGPLSHSSIVAREYGIPAVLATGVGTRRIQDRQMITVDGSAGTVTLHEKSTINSGGGIDWKAPDPKGIYMRTSVVDLMPDPLSPLYASWAIPVLRAKMKPLGVRLKMGKPVLQEDYYTSINNYAYMNANFPPRAWWWIITGMLPAYPYLLRKMVTIWREELHPEYRAAVIKYQGKIPEKMTTSELWQDAQDILDSAMYYVSGLLFATMGASAGAEGLLTRVYNKVAKQGGDPDATVLLMGWDNIPVRAEKSLYDLAMWCRQHTELAGYILATPSDQLARQLKNRRPPTNVDANEWKDLQERFERHLQQFGHIIFQLDFAEPLPLDDPAPMLENIKMYLRGEGINPHERQKASAKKRVQTAELMRNRLKGFKRWAFVKALNWGQSMAEVREDALAEIGLGYPMLRAILRELGCRFAQAGVIAQPEDIFWLQKDEVHNCVLKLEHDQRPDGLFAQVEQRKAFWKKVKQETPPPMIPMKKKFMGINTSVWLAESESNRTGNVLKGVATSTGKVTASACILHGPEDFNKMHHGDVLVAGTTTPAWTPLFAMASAIVTDIGGPLSHGSIVAREYGIPAVMGTGVATKRIHDGQTITVDGSVGIVSLS